MTLAPGTRLGCYEVSVLLGAGGMGEVYRARDTKLNRDVALKVLPTELALDPDRCGRFDREAQILASLNHPNIAAIYGLEGTVTGEDPTRSIEVLVLELVEGPTLADRIAQGPLPLEEALPIATQIADALEAAHERGILHRDLKPANIKLRRDGTVKVLDFGLAKVLDAGAGAADRSQSPTITSPAMTRIGVLLGTAAYMSPEQARGRVADKRSDVWAFGCVLYEMLAGKRAFDADDISDTIAAILRAEPDWAVLPAHLPDAVVRLLRRCLEKDHRRRLRDIGDARLELDDARSAPQSGAITGLAARRWGERAVWAAAVVALLAALGLSLLRGDRTPTSPLIHRTSILPPAGMYFSPHDFAISPDGRRVAFVSIASDGRTTLWVRSLGARGAQQLNDTEGASYPFWAPDSRRLGFFAGGELKVADTSTGGTQSLSEAPNGRGGAWNREGVIVFAPNIAGPLFRVSDRGGRSQQVTELDPKSGKAHRWPWFLPDQKHFLFFEEWGVAPDPRPSGIYAGALDGAATLISAGISGSVEFAAGHLLYVQDASLMAQPFDAQHLRLVGTAVPILDQELSPDIAFGHGNFSASSNGVILFQSLTDSLTELIWHAADGKPLDELHISIRSNPQLSPDARFLAFPADEPGGKRYIRVHDRQRGVATNVTTGGREYGPVWSRDGRTIAYVSKEGETYSLYEIPASGSGSPQRLVSGARMFPTDYSADGRYLVFMTFETGAPYIAIYDKVERRATLWGRGAEAQYSPDGKWLAFASAPSQVFVQAVTGGGSRVQISGAGGGQPRWSHDGKRLFYLAGDRKLMEVAIGVQDGQLAAGAPRALFQTHVLAPAFALFQYDLTQDASRFVVNSLRPEAPLTLVSDWPDLLRR